MIALSVAVMAAAVVSVPEPAWTWHASLAAREVVIDLVRAQVSIARRPGTLSVQAWELGPVTVKAGETSGRVDVWDQYPPRLPGVMLECLPPPTSRGDVWTYFAMPKIRIELPPGTALKVRLAEGDITVSGPDSGLDLQTLGGRVTYTP